MSDFFTSVEFENFGPIKKARLKLTRLHALIGPNDSGKSTALRGLRLLSRLAADRNLARALKEPDADLLSPDGHLAIKRGEVSCRLTRGQLVFKHLDRRLNMGLQFRHGAFRGWRPARTLRLDPDFLREAAPLLSEDAPLDFADERGTGLGGLLDAIFVRDTQNYVSLENELQKLFPTVRGFRLYTQDGRRRVGVRLIDGTDVPAEHMSEGMLYFLAFAALPYLSPVSLLLVEEPENGLHPSRIAEVMRVLRSIAEKTQVVLATHSPLVVNELKPEEVTLVTRTPQEGTKFTPITETPNFEKRASAFALGELWLNYADGITEAPLFKSTGS